MDYVDDKYIRLLSTRLEKYKHVKSGLYNFRCPYCGDSQRNKTKARGYFFLKKGEYIFKCHNCGMGRSLGNFLKDHATDLHDQYVMEKYKSGMAGKGRHTPVPKYVGAKPKFAKDVSDITSIKELNIGHPARDYLTSRLIPDDQLGRFFYVDKFKRWVNTKVQTFENLQNDRPRIIIPLIDKDGNWFGIQGRSLAPKSPLRYITIMFEDKLKLFGQDNVNPEETVYVTEGPFDSTFITNAVAMCGSDVDHRTLPYKDRVWVFDNEPRNRQIVSRIDAAIGSKEKVVIWPREVKQKDINDMVLAGLNPSDIIKRNTYSGLEAKLKFTDWKQV